MKKITALATACLLAAASHADIIISQYYEGASNDKWIELYNTGSSPVDLGAGGFRLGTWSNANRETWKTSASPTSSGAITGTLAAGATLLLKNSSAVNPAYAVGTSNSGVNFSGDDSVVLYTGATFNFANVVDAFGATANNFQDKSFVRASTVLTGTNTDFNASNWIEFSLTNVGAALAGTPERLGSHAVIPEPATAGLLCIGLLALRRFRRL